MSSADVINRFELHIGEDILQNLLTSDQSVRNESWGKVLEGPESRCSVQLEKASDSLLKLLVTVYGQTVSISNPRSAMDILQQPNIAGISANGGEQQDSHMQTEPQQVDHISSQTEGVDSEHRLSQTDQIDSEHRTSQTDQVSSEHRPSQTAEVVNSEHRVSQTEKVESESQLSQTERVGSENRVSQTDGTAASHRPIQTEGIPSSSRVSQTDGTAATHQPIQTEGIPSSSQVSQTDGTAATHQPIQTEAIPSSSQVSQTDGTAATHKPIQTDQVPSSSQVSQTDGTAATHKPIQTDGIPSSSQVSQTEATHHRDSDMQTIATQVQHSAMQAQADMHHSSMQTTIKENKHSAMQTVVKTFEDIESQTEFRVMIIPPQREQEVQAGYWYPVDSMVQTDLCLLRQVEGGCQTFTAILQDSTAQTPKVVTMEQLQQTELLCAEAECQTHKDEQHISSQTDIADVEQTSQTDISMAYQVEGECQATVDMSSQEIQASTDMQSNISQTDSSMALLAEADCQAVVEVFESDCQAVVDVFESDMQTEIVENKHMLVQTELETQQNCSQTEQSLEERDCQTEPEKGVDFECQTEPQEVETIPEPEPVPVPAEPAVEVAEIQQHGAIMEAAEIQQHAEEIIVQQLPELVPENQPQLVAEPLVEYITEQQVVEHPDLATEPQPVLQELQPVQHQIVEALDEQGVVIQQEVLQETISHEVTPVVVAPDGELIVAQSVADLVQGTQTQLIQVQADGTEPPLIKRPRLDLKDSREEGSQTEPVTIIIGDASFLVKKLKSSALSPTKVSSVGNEIEIELRAEDEPPPEPTPFDLPEKENAVLPTPLRRIPVVSPLRGRGVRTRGGGMFSRVNQANPLGRGHPFPETVGGIYGQPQMHITELAGGSTIATANFPEPMPINVVPDVPVVQGGKYSCPVCSDTFHESPTLYEHLQRMHREAFSLIKKPRGREGKTIIRKPSPEPEPPVLTPVEPILICQEQPQEGPHFYQPQHVVQVNRRPQQTTDLIGMFEDPNSALWMHSSKGRKRSLARRQITDDETAIIEGDDGEQIQVVVATEEEAEELIRNSAPGSVVTTIKEGEVPPEYLAYLGKRKRDEAEHGEPVDMVEVESSYKRTRQEAELLLEEQEEGHEDHINEEVQIETVAEIHHEPEALEVGYEGHLPQAEDEDLPEVLAPVLEIRPDADHEELLPEPELEPEQPEPLPEPVEEAQEQLAQEEIETPEVVETRTPRKRGRPSKVKKEPGIEVLTPSPAVELSTPKTRGRTRTPRK